MIQRIVQILLLITLVGQNFLSPALATHDLLHTINTTGEEVRLSPSAISSVSSFDSSTALAPSSLDPNSTYSKPVNPSALSQILADFSAFKCAEACTMLASGHCVSHCVSLTGIFIEPSLTKYRPGRSPQNHVTLWSAQTTDSLSINRPPIV
ncbi:hypothetical protein [Shewanella canadensis]|uniref:hypothetical protein n=1 Tax=Shewanella canadensis TaxID=271096 RepID=UPI001639E356|nr:hypothetical protein [Shewanella canadensis]